MAASAALILLLLSATVHAPSWVFCVFVVLLLFCFSGLWLVLSYCASQIHSRLSQSTQRNSCFRERSAMSVVPAVGGMTAGGMTCTAGGKCLICSRPEPKSRPRETIFQNNKRMTAGGGAVASQVAESAAPFEEHPPAVHPPPALLESYRISFCKLIVCLHFCSFFFRFFFRK